jgi:hypothetical protein
VKKLRKVNREKRKQNRRDAKERLADQAGAMINHPTECCVCATKFERNKETVKSWMVTVISEKKVVHLTCPECWVKVEGLVECHE